jgi:hypothetical protein
MHGNEDADTMRAAEPSTPCSATATTMFGDAGDDVMPATRTSTTCAAALRTT